MQNLLLRANTHRVGSAGLLIGGTSIVASVAALFRLVADPTYVDALFVAIMHARAHATTAADVQTYAQLVGAAVAILGAVIVALLLSYLGRPTTVPSDASGAAQASTTSPGKGP